MNVLLIGSGGREHALAWKINQSDLLTKLFSAPGNPGTSEYGQNVALNIENELELNSFLDQHEIDMVIVGPEVPLVNGLHDTIENLNLKKNPVVIGPKKGGAMLEGSKKFAKEFMLRHDIPTARYKNFNASNINEAKEFFDGLESPYVLKADGLAAGKGVLIIEDQQEAIEALKTIIEKNQFGEAGDNVVIEEFLHGIELSIFVLTDGTDYKILPSAKDYKRIGEGDTGLNTGGMGAISPAPSANKEFILKVEEKVIRPTIKGLQKDNLPYKGFIFIGLMDVNGEPQVIEYNVRLGDPETEAILPRIENDLLELFGAVKTNTLNDITLKIDERAACTIMMVSGGYPESYQKGYPITGLNKKDDVLIFQAGTSMNNNQVVTNGGRVLTVTSLDQSISMALDNSYRKLEEINFKDQYFRRDIGYEVINNEENS